MTDQREKAIGAAVVEYYRHHHDHNPRKMVHAVISEFERVMAEGEEDPPAALPADLARGEMTAEFEERVTDEIVERANVAWWQAKPDRYNVNHYGNQMRAALEAVWPRRPRNDDAVRLPAMFTGRFFDSKLTWIYPAGVPVPGYAIGHDGRLWRNGEHAGTVLSVTWSPKHLGFWVDYESWTGSPMDYRPAAPPRFDGLKRKSNA
jgi:hypothetical protein